MGKFGEDVWFHAYLYIYTRSKTTKLIYYNILYEIQSKLVNRCIPNFNTTLWHHVSSTFFVKLILDAVSEKPLASLVIDEISFGLLFLSLPTVSLPSSEHRRLISRYDLIVKNDKMIDGCFKDREK